MSYEIVKPLEVLCNVVASELLVPFELFIHEWNNAEANDKQEKISLLAKTFRCSESVIARKALDAKKISKKLYEDIVSDQNTTAILAALGASPRI